MKYFHLIFRYVVFFSIIINQNLALGETNTDGGKPDPVQLVTFEKIKNKINNGARIFTYGESAMFCRIAARGSTILMKKALKKLGNPSWATLHSQIQCKEEFIPFRNGNPPTFYKVDLVDMLFRGGGEKVFYNMLEDIIKNNPEYLPVLFNEKKLIKLATTEIPNQYLKLQNRICEYVYEWTRLKGEGATLAEQAKGKIRGFLYAIYDLKEELRKNGIKQDFAEDCDYTVANPRGFKIRKTYQ